MLRRAKKWLILSAVALCCLLALGVCLMTVQGSLSERSQRSSQQKIVSDMWEMFDSFYNSLDATMQAYDEVYRSKTETLAYMVREQIDPQLGQEEMRTYRDVLEVTNALVLDRQGNVLVAADGTVADFTRKRFNQLRTVFATGEPSQGFDVETTKGTLRFYGARVDPDRMVVVEQSTGDLTELMKSKGRVENLLDNVRIGRNGYACAIYVPDYSFLYHPDSSLIEEDAIEAGLTQEDLTDGHSGYMTLGGEKIYASVARYGDVYILCAIPEWEMNASRNMAVLIVMAVFISVMLLVCAYAVFLHREHEQDDASGSRRFNGRIARKISVLSGAGLLLILLVSLYIQTLYGVSQFSVMGMQRIREVEETIAANEEDVELLRSQYGDSYLSKCRTAAFILQKKPELATRSQLQRLCDALGTEGIFIFDRDGRLTATSTPYSNFRISQNPEDQSFAFNKLLMGREYLVQEAMADEISGEYRQYIGVSLRDAEGSADGFVQISLVPEQLEQALSSLDLATILAGVKSENDGYAFAVSKADGTILYHPERKYIGSAAQAYGMTEEQLCGGYCDYLTFDHEKIFAASTETEDALIYVAMPVEATESARLPISLITTGVSLICLTLLSLLLSMSTRDSGGERPPREGAAVSMADVEDAAADERVVDVVMPDGSTRRTESAASRWDNFSVEWNTMTPEQRVMAILHYMMGIVAVLSCVALFFGKRIFSENSVFAYIISGRWARGINIFSITATLMIVCVASVVTSLLNRLLKLMARTFDAHTATLCRLTINLIKYASVLSVLYFCLALFGVDTKTLLASAGILTLVISLGAKELVSDVIAGLFIIFESEFRVGDIVTIGDWRGKVLEIGIRTTKVENAEGNIKIFSNSAVSGVINMTQRYSLAVCDVSVDYRESLVRIEGILRRELPLIAHRLPAIRQGPDYMGVVELADSGVLLRIIAYCSEEDRIQLTRDLNREIKLMCDRWRISIPFPQVVINEPDSFENLPEADKKKDAR